MAMASDLLIAEVKELLSGMGVEVAKINQAIDRIEPAERASSTVDLVDQLIGQMVLVEQETHNAIESAAPPIAHLSAKEEKRRAKQAKKRAKALEQQIKRLRKLAEKAKKRLSKSGYRPSSSSHSEEDDRRGFRGSLRKLRRLSNSSRSSIDGDTSQRAEAEQQDPNALIQQLVREKEELRAENQRLLSGVDANPLQVARRLQDELAFRGQELSLEQLIERNSEVDRQLEVLRASGDILANLKSDLERRIEEARAQLDDEEDGETLEDASSCVVCMDEVPTHALIPCGHRCVGENCVGMVQECPLCRTVVQSSIKIFDV